MAKYLPSGESADFKYRISLEGTGYDIRTRWNNRGMYWVVELGPTGQSPVISTKALVGRDILANYAVDDIPPGYLYVVDTKKLFGRPSLDDFGLGKRFRLLYVNSDETDPIENFDP